MVDIYLACLLVLARDCIYFKFSNLLFYLVISGIGHDVQTKQVSYLWIEEKKLLYYIRDGVIKKRPLKAFLGHTIIIAKPNSLTLMGTLWDVASKANKGYQNSINCLTPHDPKIRSPGK